MAEPESVFWHGNHSLLAKVVSAQTQVGSGIRAGTRAGMDCAIVALASRDQGRDGLCHCSLGSLSPSLTLVSS